MLRLEVLRHAGDHEIGRLRLMAGIAIGSWIGTLFFSARLVSGPVGARVVLAHNGHLREFARSDIRILKH